MWRVVGDWLSTRCRLALWSGRSQRIRMEDTAGGTGAITTTASLRLRLCVSWPVARWPNCVHCPQDEWPERQAEGIR